MGEKVTRRDFLKGLAVGAAAGVVASAGVAAAVWPKPVTTTLTSTSTVPGPTTTKTLPTTLTTTKTVPTTTTVTTTTTAPLVVPASKGYLLVDKKKCAGCLSCMLACSLVHEGKESLSLSRIQVIQDPFENYPDDISQYQCRQCERPLCLEACPVGAIYADPENGYVRTINEEKCIGCRRCVEACPYIPHRIIWNFDKKVAMKCDLCANAPYWSEKGGPNGKQACVEACPVKAIKFTSEMPTQLEDFGYYVNLRKEGWAMLGFPTD